NSSPSTFLSIQRERYLQRRRGCYVFVFVFTVMGNCAAKPKVKETDVLPEQPKEELKIEKEVVEVKKVENEEKDDENKKQSLGVLLNEITEITSKDNKTQEEPVVVEPVEEVVKAEITEEQSSNVVVEAAAEPVVVTADVATPEPVASVEVAPAVTSVKENKTEESEQTEIKAEEEPLKKTNVDVKPEVAENVTEEAVEQN
ncbi:hypothetical protein, partial [Ralstonia pseudosolanacearum]|uniref:hypothetical protein n=1 Tax=Ralstonia pseudosolanacearum TaxID=1310165 RepID=UPI003CF92169